MRETMGGVSGMRRRRGLGKEIREGMRDPMGSRFTRSQREGRRGIFGGRAGQGQGGVKLAGWGRRRDGEREGLNDGERG